MALKLTNRAGVWHVVGTVRLSNGAKLRIRQSTGCPLADRSNAEVMLSEVYADLARSHRPSPPPPLVSAAPTDATTVADVVGELLLRHEVKPGVDALLMDLARDFGPQTLRDLDLGEVARWLGARF